jgi:hypothetical protein
MFDDRVKKIIAKNNLEKKQDQDSKQQNTKLTRYAKTKEKN